MPKEVPVPNVKYPAGLLDWAGHGRGGVRQPFINKSGRPTGKQIKTPLVERLSVWSKDLTDGGEVPRIIFLVGGPGNGKTDAIEGCLDSMDNSLGDSGKLTSMFKEIYHSKTGTVPPRKVVVSRTQIKRASHLENVKTITLIQDATEEDMDQPDKSAEELLLEDMLEAEAGSSCDIYLCCVNRGILASAARIASENTEKYPGLIELLEVISEAVTNSATPAQCWPLRGYPHIAVWPMDMESLVDSTSENKSQNQSVAHEIFEQVLDEKNWSNICAAGKRCPFCENRRLLTNGENLNHLIGIMRRYELTSGKRWTFRDLFSFIAYLLAGDFSELKVRGKSTSPCEWAAYQLRLLDQSQSSEDENERAPFLLVSKLYYHRVFPLWPKLKSKSIKRALESVGRQSPELNSSTRHMFKFVNWFNVYYPKASGDVPDWIRVSLAPALDPALIRDPNADFRSTGSLDLKLSDLETAFSTSVKQGIDSTKEEAFPEVERELLSRLSKSDVILDSETIPEYEKLTLRSELRQFAIRLVKRSLGVRSGLTKDTKWLDEFSSLATKKKLQKDITKTLKNLLQEGRFFKAAAATTFGQPVAQRSKDVSIAVEANTKIKIVENQQNNTRPKNPMSFLEVQGTPLGITFELYKALREVSQGLHEASLPENVYALLDRVKAAMTGSIIREPGADKTIQIEGIGFEMEIDEEEFSS